MPRKGSWLTEDYRATCPLHIAYREDEIICRSHMAGSCMTIHRYTDMQAAEIQRTTYCTGKCWERCEHYLAWKHFAWEDDEE